MAVRAADLRGIFGSLDNGTAPTELRPDRLLIARNLLRDQTKAVGKRPGMRMKAQIASYPENAVAPVLTNLGATSGSTLGNGTLYVRITYSTVNGETDDLHSTEASIATAAGDGVSVQFPFHIFNQQVQFHEAADGAVILNDTFNSERLAGLANGSFNGYYLFSRDPTIQDETRLGVNPRFKKLWDRKNWLGIVSDYTAADYTFEVAPAIAVSLVGTRVDLRMPDINGHPIRAANVYVSSNGTDFYLFESYGPDAQSTDVYPGTVNVTSVPTSNKRAPSTRITRTAPTVAAADATETDPGLGSTVTKKTSILGGLYILRYTWETEDADFLDSGGWPEQSDFLLGSRNRQACQETWPSRASLAAVADDQAITVTLPSRPQGAERAHVYAKKLTPSETLTFSGVTNPSSTHRAYVYPMTTTAGAVVSGNGDYTIMTALLAASTPTTWRGISSGLEYLTSDLTTGAGGTEQLLEASYAALYPQDGNIARLQHYTASGWQGQGGFVHHQFEFKLSAGQKASTTHVCLVLRCGGADTLLRGYHPYTPYMAIRRWNEGTAAWVAVTPENAHEARSITGREMVTHRAAVAFTTAQLDSNDRFIFDIYGANGLEPTIDYVALELYTDSVATDPSVTAGEVRQDPPGIKVTSSFAMETSLVTANEGLPIRPNTTAQAPVTLHADYVANYKGGSDDQVLLVVGSADSVFIEENGALVRIYSHDREDGCNSAASLKVCEYDWQFSNLWNRVFFCNEGNDLPYNFRFDGIQTHPMGLEAPKADGNTAPPPPGEEPTPDDNPDPWGCARFVVLENYTISAPGIQVYVGHSRDYVNAAKYPRWVVTDPDGGRHEIMDYRDTCLSATEKSLATSYGAGDKLGQIFEATATGRDSGGATRIIPVTTTYTEDILNCLRGDPPPEPEVLPPSPGEVPLDPGEYDYRSVHIRTLEGEGAEGRGYIVQSKPVTLRTVTVPEGGGRPLLYVPAPDDPQVTKVGVARSLRGTADYLLVGETEVTPGALTDAGDIVFIDETPDNDASLAFFLEKETGRPPVATRMTWHRRRLWLTPLYNKTAILFSNISSASGALDPEGVYAKNEHIPAHLRQGAITALAPLGDVVLAHSDNGIAAITGISDDLGAGNAIGSVGVYGGAGAIGPKAWTNHNRRQFFTSREGVHVIAGGEPDSLTAMVEGTIKAMNRQDSAARFMRVAHYRQDGVSLLLFSYSDREDGRPDKALTFDLNVGAGMEEDRRLWAEWTELFAHDMERVEVPNGSERLFIGDHWGRIHEIAVDTKTDNGLFIDADILGAPLELSGSGKSFQLTKLILTCQGREDDAIRLDYYKDLSSTPHNDRQIRMLLTGTGAAKWGDVGAEWGAANSPGTWASVGVMKGWNEVPANLTGVFRQVMFRFSQRATDMPPGYRRDAQFQLSRYKVWLEDKGLRRHWP